MPSPDFLPPGRHFTVEPPPPLDAVLSRARRRRRARATALGVATAGAAALAVLLVVPSDTTASLKVVTPAAGTTPSAGPSAGPGSTTATGRAAGHQVGAGQQGTSANGRSSGGAAAVPPAAPNPAAGSGRPAASGTAGIVGPPHRTTAYDTTRTCAGSGPTPATGWCSYYDGATSGPAGQPVELSFAVCRLPGQATGTLVSSNGQQADFAVGVRSYPASWTWSHGRHFAAHSTSLDVPPGSCVQWRVSWRVTDDAGRPLAPGSYYLDSAPYAVPSGSTQSASTSSPVTFTVTK